MLEMDARGTRRVIIRMAILREGKVSMRFDGEAPDTLFGGRCDSLPRTKPALRFGSLKTRP